MKIAVHLLQPRQIVSPGHPASPKAMMPHLADEHPVLSGPIIERFSRTEISTVRNSICKLDRITKPIVNSTEQSVQLLDLGGLKGGKRLVERAAGSNQDAFHHLLSLVGQHSFTDSLIARARGNYDESVALQSLHRARNCGRLHDRLSRRLRDAHWLMLMRDHQNSPAGNIEVRGTQQTFHFGVVAANCQVHVVKWPVCQAEIR